MKGIITTMLCLTVILATPPLSLAAELILVKGGRFMMGSTGSEISHGKDEARRSVVLSDFHLAP